LPRLRPDYSDPGWSFRARDQKKASRLFVSDFHVINFCYSFLLLHSVNGADGDPKRVGDFFFQQKTLSCFLISHFILTEWAGKSFYRLSFFSMALLGLGSLLVFSFSPLLWPLLALSPLPIITQNCHTSIFLAGKGKTKTKKGDP